MRSLQAQWFEDVLFVPGHACLYDLSGRRIVPTMRLREGRLLRTRRELRKVSGLSRFLWGQRRDADARTRET